MDVNNLREMVHHNQVPEFFPRDDLENPPTKCHVVGVETSGSFMRGMKIKGEPEDFDCNIDEDDFSLDNTMLKRISGQRKTKKRKRLDFVGLGKETVEIYSSVKQKFPNFQNIDNKYDFQEPLFSSKSKILKNIKSCNDDLPQLNQDWPAPIDVKVEIPETKVNILKTGVPYPMREPQYCSLNKVSYEYMENSENKLDVGVSGCETLLADNSQTVKEPQYCSLNEVSYEYRENFEAKFDVGVSSWDTVVVQSPEIIKEPQFCSFNEASYEFMENFETKFDAGVSTWEIVQVHSPETLSNEFSNFSRYTKEDHDVSSELTSQTNDYRGDVHDSYQNESHKREMPWQTSCYNLIQVPETTIASGMETRVTFPPIKCSVSDEVSYEYTEDYPKFGAGFSGCETVKVDSSEMISYYFSDLQEFGKESYTVDPLAFAVPSESVSPTKDHCTDFHDSPKGNSSEHKMTSQTCNYGRAEVPGLDSDNCSQCLEHNNKDSACFLESSTHDWSSNIRNVAISPTSDNSLYQSSSCLNPEKHSGLDSGYSSSLKKQPSAPALITSNYFDASGKPLASPGPQDYHQIKHQHRAQRLHLRRKVISPTSRERLCRAMGLTGLDENECHQCRGKLCFGKYANQRILRVQGLDGFWRDGVTIKPKSTMSKEKQDEKGSPTKGILKVNHPSQCRTQNVIAFTQGQMQDFKSLATKLTTELKSMKDFVKGKFRLQSEASAAVSAKQNAEEARVAIENATRAEETARRWLSMMARDCNRFCKIMKLTEDNTAAPEHEIQKGRKVSFADEAGGKLWHVKGI